MKDKPGIVIQGGNISVGDVIQGDRNTITKVSPAPSQQDSKRVRSPARATDRGGIFLCYNRRELIEMQSLRQRLAAAGVDVWVDEAAVQAGTQWQDELASAVAIAKCALVLIGREGVGAWQTMEIKAFISRMLEHECMVIPVLLPHADAQQVPLFLQQLNYIDLRLDYADGLQRLIVRLKEVRG